MRITTLNGVVQCSAKVNDVKERAQVNDVKFFLSLLMIFFCSRDTELSFSFSLIILLYFLGLNCNFDLFARAVICSDENSCLKFS